MPMRATGCLLAEPKSIVAKSSNPELVKAPLVRISTSPNVFPVKEDTRGAPLISNFAVGLLVPIPTNPLFLSTHINGLDVPTAKSALPPGVEVPTYRDPANEEVAVVEVAMRFGRVVVP